MKGAQRQGEKATTLARRAPARHAGTLAHNVTEAYIDDMPERGRKIRRSLIELKQAKATGKVEICMCPRRIGSRWEHGNVLPAGSKGSL